MLRFSFLLVRTVSHPSRIKSSAVIAILVLLSIPSTAALSQGPATPARIGSAFSPQGRQVTLEDQLRIGLKAFTPSELAFIDLVVLRVNQGVLPRRLVDSAFLWARNRHLRRPGAHRLRPMVYFRPALVLLAGRIGVSL